MQTLSIAIFSVRTFQSIICGPETDVRRFAFAHCTSFLQRELTDFVRTMCAVVVVAFEDGFAREASFLRSIRSVPGDQLWPNSQRSCAQRGRAADLVRFCLEVRAFAAQLRAHGVSKARDASCRRTAALLLSPTPRIGSKREMQVVVFGREPVFVCRCVLSISVHRAQSIKHLGRD